MFKKIDCIQKKYLILHFSRVACMGVCGLSWVGIFMLVSPHYQEMSVGFMLIAIWFWLFSDAILTTFLKGDLFSPSNNTKIVYFVQKGWYYLDFILGIPIFLYSISDMIKYGIGVPA